MNTISFRFIFGLAFLFCISSARADQIPAVSSAALSGAALPLGSGDTDIGEGPWEVGAVKVSGEKNIKAKVIVKTGTAKEGQLYSREDISKSIELLMNLGSLEKVSVDINPIAGSRVSDKLKDKAGLKRKVEVTYVIQEKPAVDKIIVENQKGLSKSTVKEAMSTKEKDFYDEMRMRQDIQAVTDKYREKGFIDASVSFDVKTDTGSNKCDITVRIKEGPKAKIKEVKFSGVTAFKEKKLWKKFQNRPKKIYTPNNIKTDLAALESFYKNNGYSDFAVTGSSVVFSPDRSDVVFNVSVEEGKKQKFGKTYFRGNTVYLSSDFTGDIIYREGALYKEDDFRETVAAVQNRYADKGYLRAEISEDKSFNETTGETDITFLVTEHDPVYVGHIDVEGNEATKTYVLRREITQKEGEVFSASKIRRSQEKLFNLGFIDDVQLVMNPSEDPDKVDLVFDVSEGKPGMLTAGMGYSSTDHLVGTLSLTHLNMFGRAIKTSLSWNFGSSVNDYSLNVSSPWIFGRPITAGASVFNTHHYKSYGTSTSAYKERSTGGKISFSPRFSDDKYFLTGAYTLKRSEIYDVEDEYESAISTYSSLTSSIYLGGGIDTRDSTWDPTRGGKLSLGLEWAGGPLMGDNYWYKPTLDASYNIKLFSIGDYPFVMAFSNRFCFIEGYSGHKVPVSERFFLGGADSVRGYESSGQIGPLEGGYIYDVLNVEFKMPIAREKRRTIVQGAFFFDMGGAWKNFSDMKLETGTGSDMLKMGVGFGIRFTTPAFPIRLDWGYGLNHKVGEDLSDIYFTIGSMF